MYHDPPRLLHLHRRRRRRRQDPPRRPCKCLHRWFPRAAAAALSRFGSCVSRCCYCYALHFSFRCIEIRDSPLCISKDRPFLVSNFVVRPLKSCDFAFSLPLSQIQIPTATRTLAAAANYPWTGSCNHQVPEALCYEDAFHKQFCERLGHPHLICHGCMLSEFIGEASQAKHGVDARSAAAKIGKLLGERLLFRGILAVSVSMSRDQMYHGKVRAVIDSLRAAGVKLL
uniref:50S ribosomal protein L18 n=1 Tax=Oryza punctata TaxID=4537 RepID=A0A0E0KHR2_ORYPU